MSHIKDNLNTIQWLFNLILYDLLTCFSNLETKLKRSRKLIPVIDY